MLSRALLASLLFVPLGVMACSSDDDGAPADGSGGGSTNTGGAGESGGSSGSGGARSTGGSSSSGGTPQPDGGPASGGVAGGGGTSGSGGTKADASPPAEGGPEDAAPGAPTCALISGACGIIDSPQQLQAVRDCAALGGSDEATCQAALDGCRTLCAPSLCTRLGSFCHDPDPGSGPLHECHEFNHRGAQDGATAEEVAWCFNEAPRCFALCEAAQ